jgi:hypothetical protein
MQLLKKSFLENQEGICNNLIQSIVTQKRIAFQYSMLIWFSALALFVASCTKDKHIDFRNKKWQTASQIATPLWTDPATGKSYPDLFDFAKEVFPCVVDDYIIFHEDGTTSLFYNTLRCDPKQPDKQSTPGHYTYDNAADPLILLVPFEVPGQPIVITTFRCKVLDVTKDKLVIRYNQIVPFTFTPHTVTQTYKRIP